jgi:RimJ/RimL family protein N-acetyltransferase
LIGWSGAGPSAATGEVELVYSLGKPYWGQGFATEAARAVARYSFENRAWDPIVAAIIPGNSASQRVLEHLGFVYEKDVNYDEMTGDTTMEMDSPIVPYFVLWRERFAPGDAFYRVKDAAG